MSPQKSAGASGAKKTGNSGNTKTKATNAAESSGAMTKFENDVVKQKRKRPDVAERDSVHLEPGENTSYTAHTLSIAALPSIDTNDADAMEKRTREYFSLCAQHDMKPSWAGLALAYGIDRRTLWTWCTQRVDKPPRVVDTLKKAKLALTALMEDYMQNGKINPVSGIFLMKNNMGYQDKQEYVLTPNQPMGETVDAAQLIDAAGELPDE